MLAPTRGVERRANVPQLAPTRSAERRTVGDAGPYEGCGDSGQCASIGPYEGGGMRANVGIGPYGCGKAGMQMGAAEAVHEKDEYTEYTKI